MVFAVIATGLEKSSSCQPDADSPLNVPVASSVPVALHKLPVCEPVLSDVLVEPDAGDRTRCCWPGTAGPG